MTLQCPRHIFEKYSNTEFRENPSSGSRVVTCGQTDWHGETKSRSFFFNFSNTPKKQILSNPDTAPNPHLASIKVCEQKCLSNGISKFTIASIYRDKFRWTYSGAVPGFHCTLLTDTSITGEPRSACLKAVLHHGNGPSNIARITKCMHGATFVLSPRQPSDLGKGYAGNKTCLSIHF